MIKLLKLKEVVLTFLYSKYVDSKGEKKSVGVVQILPRNVTSYHMFQ